MAACVLELVQSEGVHGHAQPYVRRSALLASAQVTPVYILGLDLGFTQIASAQLVSVAASVHTWSSPTMPQA